jgi:hypothetical protein
MSYQFLNPRLRPQTQLCLLGNAKLIYLSNEFALEFDSPEQKETFEVIFNALQTCQSYDDLSQLVTHHNIDLATLNNVLAQLDECRLLMEAPEETAQGMSGIEFAFHIEDRYFNEWKPALGESELTTLFLDGKPSEDVMVGWSFEYYNVTKMAHDAIIGAIPNVSGKLKALAVNFYNEEYRHDQLMMRSIKALGFSKEQIHNAVPLPATQYLINLLAYWGKTDPLSYMSSLFIYEGEVADYGPYLESLRDNNMPEDFIEGQAVHYDINVTGDHCNETREFLQNIPFVSTADVVRVEANLQLLLGVEQQLHSQILDYYNNATIGIPRNIN